MLYPWGILIPLEISPVPQPPRRPSKAARQTHSSPLARKPSPRSGANYARHSIHRNSGGVDDGLERLQKVLAAAGLERLGHEARISEVLRPPNFWPAVAQGALVIQINSANNRVRELLRPIHHPETYFTTIAERALLSALAGGCLAPIGSWGRFKEGKELSLGGCVLSDRRGKIEIVTATCSSSVDDSESAVSLGLNVAAELLNQGAQPLLDIMRDDETLSN